MMRYMLACIIALSIVLSTGCSNKDDGGTNGPTTTGTTGGASGTVTIDVSALNGETLVGTLTVTLDSLVLEIPVSITVSAGNETLSVNYSFAEVPFGRKNLTFYLNLATAGGTMVYAGYSIVPVNIGQTTLVAEGAYIHFTVTPSFQASGAPVFSNVQIDQDSVSTPVVTISGTITNMDYNVIFIYVNNNCFPVIIEPDGTGSAVFSKVLTLDAQTNIIYIAAVNSSGLFGYSGNQIAYYTFSASGRHMLATLIWDTPTSDMDLHAFYYPTANPDFTQPSTTHCCWWDQNVFIEPTDDNLDVDDREGEGPEHITFLNYPDGYYVFALNSYALDEDTHAMCTFTISTGTQQRSLTHTFYVSNYEEYDTDLDGWKHCYDVRVTGGIPVILNPDSRFDLTVFTATAKRAAGTRKPLD